jgi:LPS O-antigen subunit length determinant protein (WzzB/FepE family)
MENTQENPKNPQQIMMPYGYMPHCAIEEDEIDLRELWQVLKRRKRTVLTTTFLFLILALGYILFAKPVYEAKATIGIGKQLVKSSDGVLHEKYFDDAKHLKQMLDVKYDTAGKYREKNATAYIDSVSIPKKTNGFLTITANAPSNAEAIKTIRKPIDVIIARHRVYFNSIIDTKKHEIETLTKQLAYFETVERQKLKGELDLVKSIDLKKIDDRIRLVKSVQIPSIKEKIKESEKEIADKEKAIADMQTRISTTAKQDPTLAAMAAMQMANLQNDIARLSKGIIDYRLKIQKLLEETIPDLEKEKKRILEKVIPDLEKEKKRILEKVIPEKEAAVKKLESMTIPKLSAKIDELKTFMKPPYIEMTKVVGKIYTRDYPVKPKKKLIIAVAVVTGLMLGVFLVFFLEFIGKNQEKNEGTQKESA